MGDSTINNMYGYLRALSIFGVGDCTKIIMDRNGEEIEKGLNF